MKKLLFGMALGVITILTLAPTPPIGGVISPGSGGSSSNQVVAIATNAVVVAAGANIGVSASGNAAGGVTYTVSTQGGAAATNAIGNLFGFGTNTTLIASNQWALRIKDGLSVTNDNARFFNVSNGNVIARGNVIVGGIGTFFQAGSMNSSNSLSVGKNNDFANTTESFASGDNNDINDTSTTGNNNFGNAILGGQGNIIKSGFGNTIIGSTLSINEATSVSTIIGEDSRIYPDSDIAAIVGGERNNLHGIGNVLVGSGLTNYQGMDYTIDLGFESNKLVILPQQGLVHFVSNDVANATIGVNGSATFKTLNVSGESVLNDTATFHSGITADGLGADTPTVALGLAGNNIITFPVPSGGTGIPTDAGNGTNTVFWYNPGVDPADAKITLDIGNRTLSDGAGQLVMDFSTDREMFDDIGTAAMTFNQINRLLQSQSGASVLGFNSATAPTWPGLASATGDAVLQYNTTSKVMSYGTGLSLAGDITFKRSSSPMLSVNTSAAVVTVNANNDGTTAAFVVNGNAYANLMTANGDRNRVTFGLAGDLYANGAGAFMEVNPSVTGGTNAFRVDKYNNAAVGSEAFAVRTNGTTVIAQGLIIATNTAPANVIIGVTDPDVWVWATNNGVAFAWPAWKTH